MHVRVEFITDRHRRPTPHPVLPARVVSVVYERPGDDMVVISDISEGFTDTSSYPTLTNLSVSYPTSPYTIHPDIWWFWEFRWTQAMFFKPK